MVGHVQEDDIPRLERLALGREPLGERSLGRRAQRHAVDLRTHELHRSPDRALEQSSVEQPAVVAFGAEFSRCQVRVGIRSVAREDRDLAGRDAARLEDLEHLA